MNFIDFSDNIYFPCYLFQYTEFLDYVISEWQTMLTCHLMKKQISNKIMQRQRRLLEKED